MSKVCRRKHVMNEEMWNDDALPQENQYIVKVLKSRGNNLHAVVCPTGEEYLVSMPNKFRKNIWVKRGSYILVEPIPEGDKVKAEIVKIMNKESIKFFKEKNLWPKEFEESNSKEENKVTNSSSDDELFVNPNRVPASVLESDSSDSSDSEYSSDNEYSSDSDNKKKEKYSI